MSRLYKKLKRGLTELISEAEGRSGPISRRTVLNLPKKQKTVQTKQTNLSLSGSSGTATNWSGQYSNTANCPNCSLRTSIHYWTNPTELEEYMEVSTRQDVALAMEKALAELERAE